MAFQWRLSSGIGPGCYVGRETVKLGQLDQRATRRVLVLNLQILENELILPTVATKVNGASP